MIKYILQCDRCGETREFADFDEYDDAIQDLNTVVFHSLQNCNVICKGEVCDKCRELFLEICNEFYDIANSFFIHRNGEKAND